MRSWSWLPVLLAAVLPAPATAADAPYYGPMKRWHGIGYRFGYEDRTEKDGTWRVDAAIHGGGADAIDMALYRAAERAREAGYAYLFLLGGEEARSPGIDAATVYARPSREPVAPVGCRSTKPTTCYTAEVAAVLRLLGGPDGTRPGVPVVDHRDALGREVFLSGYGTGAVATPIAGAGARGRVTTIVENRRAMPMPMPMTPRPVPAAGMTRGGVTEIPSPPLPAAVQAEIARARAGGGPAGSR